MEYISILDLGRAVGQPACVREHDCNTFKEQIELKFPGLCKRRRLEGRRSKGLLWAIPANAKASVLEVLGYEESKESIALLNLPVTSAAEKAKKILEDDGWIVNLLAPNPSGTPDLIMHKNGVVRYREVKATEDGLRRHQWAEIMRLRSIGHDAWVCDDEGIDWLMMS